MGWGGEFFWLMKALVTSLSANQFGFFFSKKTFSFVLNLTWSEIYSIKSKIDNVNRENRKCPVALQTRTLIGR